jgi:hypothetical protein
MLLTLNAKNIGGMTTEELEIELETCGSVLQLTVSRYKRSTLAKKAVDHAERRVLDQVDNLLNDKYNLEWIDAMGPDLTVLVHDLHEHLPSEGNDVTPSIMAKDKIDGDARSHGIVNVPSPKAALHVSGSPTKPDPPTLDKYAPSPDTSRADSDDSLQSDFSAMLREGINDRSPDSSKPNANQGEDDLYVANGCVCGVTHVRLAVYWIMCDGCDTWYCNAEKCTGMTGAEAAMMENWLCPACEECPNDGFTSMKPATDQTSLGTVSAVPASTAPKDDNKTLQGFTLSPSASHSHVHQSVPHGSGIGAEVKGSKSEAVDGSTDRKEVYEDDAIVYVREHAWPGVDNPAGIAKIMNSRVGENNDRVYDIKYVVGGMRRYDVDSEYIRQHSWDHPEGW